MTGPPKYAAAAMKSTLQPKRLSQAFALSASPLLMYAGPEEEDGKAPEVRPARDSGSFEYDWGMDEGSEMEPPAWYELAYDDGSLLVRRAAAVFGDDWDGALERSDEEEAVWNSKELPRTE